MKTCELIRVYEKDQTEGKLYFGGQEIKTIERADLDNAPMVSCIPEGNYVCKWGHMKTHNVDHYELQSVPGRTGIFIHIATLAEQLNGCIGSDRVSIGALETWGNKEDFLLIIRS